MEMTTKNIGLYMEREIQGGSKNQRNVKEGNRKLFALKIEKCSPELRTNIVGMEG